MTMIALHEMIPGFGPSADISYDRLDHELLVRAYKFSDVAHAGQVRHSGEPYVSHCIEVARILADLQLDTTTREKPAPPANFARRSTNSK